MTRFQTALVYCLLLSGIVAGQSYQGQITGVVEDTTGAVIPNAKIVATNVATGLAFSTESNSQGIYRLIKSGHIQASKCRGMWGVPTSQLETARKLIRGRLSFH